MKAPRQRLQDINYQQLEAYLQGMLPQVSPRQDFVASLRQRLAEMPARRGWLPTALLFIMITLAALVSGLVLLATSLRALVTIVATLSLIYKLRSSSKETPASSTRLSG